MTIIGERGIRKGTDRANVARRMLYRRKQTSVSNSITLGKLTPAFIDMFCAMISRGHYFATACKAMRVSESTFQSWMRLGKHSPEGIYHDFYERVMQADAAAESYAVEKWRGHFDRDPRASRDFLARRYPERWSERRYIRLAVDREVEQMMRELQRRLPEEVFLLVVSELASIEGERQLQTTDEILEGN